MSASPLKFASVNDLDTQALADIGHVFKGRSAFSWIDPMGRPTFGVRPDCVQVGDELLGAREPPSDDNSFQVALIVRNVAPNSSRLFGDAIVIPSLACGEPWFPARTKCLI